MFVSIKYWIRIYYYNNSFILYVKRNFKSALCNFILFILSPYIVLNAICKFIYEIAYGKKNIYKLMLRDLKKKFLNEIAIVTIVKNEGSYIREWIEYHRLVGINKFYFYDNDSTDNTMDILKPYIDSGIVEYTLLSGKAKQLIAYNDAIKKYKNECRWMAFIDLDEYLMPTKPFESVSNICNRLVQNASKGAVGVGVNWAVYGSSYYEKKVQGLVIENYTMRGENYHWGNFHIKTICNPRMVKNYISPHYPLYKLGGYSISESTGERLYGWFCHTVEYRNMRINHYFTKSKEEFIQKRNRGLGDRLGKYDMDMFSTYDLNDIQDRNMAIYIEEIKKVLHENG